MPGCSTRASCCRSSSSSSGIRRRAQFGLAESVAAYPALPGGIPLLAPFTPEYLGVLAWEHWVISICAATIGTLVVAFMLRQAALVRAGERVNGPKMLFLAAVVPLHVYVCFSEAVLSASLLAFAAFVTIFHDIQYHAIIWFHHRNRYHREGVDKKKFGLAPKVSKNLGTYFGCSIFFALIFRLLGCTLDVHPGCVPFVITSEVELFGGVHTDALLKAFLLGFPLHHYFVDQYIWKTSKDKQLQKDLNVTERRS